MGLWLHEQETPTTQELERIFHSLLEIEKVFAALNGQHSLPLAISFGAAVNTGYAATGNLGSKALPDHTAIGDTVNMAFSPGKRDSRPGRRRGSRKIDLQLRVLLCWGV